MSRCAGQEQRGEGNVDERASSVCPVEDERLTAAVCVVERDVGEASVADGDTLTRAEPAARRGAIDNGLRVARMASYATLPTS